MAKYIYPAIFTQVGRDWFSNEDEPYPDSRAKNCKYIGWREKQSGTKMGLPHDVESGTSENLDEKTD